MNRVVHFEIHVDDPDRASEFYNKTFGWEFNKWEGDPNNPYWLIKTGEADKPGIDGGMLIRRDPKGNVYNTLNVENIDKAFDDVKSNGGQIVVEKMPVPGVGWLAYFTDTEGNIFGIMQMDDKAGA